MARGRILLADDNKLVVKVNTALLEDAGHSVIVAWDGLEAINKSYTEEPDLIILDIEMPKINGYQVCRLLKDDEFTKETPVIMLTGRERQSDVFWGMKTGADAYIVKGFKPEQLIDTIEELLDRAGGADAGKEPRSSSGKLVDESGVFSRVIDLLDTRLFESTVLNELGSLAALSQDYRATVKGVLDILAGVLGNTVGAVFLFEEEDLVVNLSGATDRASLERSVDMVFEEAEALGWNAESREIVERTVFGEENLTDPEEGEEPEAYSCVNVPLSVKKSIIGLVMLGNRESPAFVRYAREMLKLVLNQLAIVIDNARLYEATRQLAITDGLTRVYNHRFFHELFEKEQLRADRYNTSFSLVMLDIDNFKKVNDTYGHLCGDDILKELARLLKACLRSVDTVARYGGEEFALLLPETSGGEAFKTAERIRRTVEDHSFMGAGDGLRITVSQGVSAYPGEDVRERFDVIAKADQALYEAKETGRNRVVFHR